MHLSISKSWTTKIFALKCPTMKKEELTLALLNWYKENGRILPWRHKGGAHPSPYAVFVSEIMLQQTTVATVLTYFERFMTRFPTVQDLAKASQDEIYAYWQGLGYYARARSLHQTAQAVCSQYGGVFPHTRSEVSKLKGFGPYTIASFLALAYNLPETVVDGNVMRIMCRLNRWTQPLDEMMLQIRSFAAELTSEKQPADYASAIMDLGATVCTPKKPKCHVCPWKDYCQSANTDNVEQIPQRAKMTKKEFNGYVWVIKNQHNEVLLRKRTEKGLLHGLYELPWSEDKIYQSAQDIGKSVSHIFTHIKMTLKIMLVEAKTCDDGFFVPLEKMHEYPMSTLMKKILHKI